MADVFQHRRGTAAQWSTVNPILNSGEIGYAFDVFVIKLGDGTTAWNELPIALSGTFVDQTTFDNLASLVANIQDRVDDLPVSLDDAFATKAELNALPTTLSTVFVEKNANAFQTATYATPDRPLATAVGVGAMIFDSTLNMPIWSNGTVWVNAVGAAV